MQSIRGAHQALCAPPWRSLRSNHRPEVILFCAAHPEYGELRLPQLEHVRCPLRWQLRGAGEEDALLLHPAHTPCQPYRPFPAGALPSVGAQSACTLGMPHALPLHHTLPAIHGSFASLTWRSGSQTSVNLNCTAFQQHVNGLQGVRSALTRDDSRRWRGMPAQQRWWSGSGR